MWLNTKVHFIYFYKVLESLAEIWLRLEMGIGMGILTEGCKKKVAQANGFKNPPTTFIQVCEQSEMKLVVQKKTPTLYIKMNVIHL